MYTTATKRWRSHKNQAAMDLLTLFQYASSIRYGDKESRSSASISALPDPTTKLTPRPILAASRVSKYIENDLQQILKVVLEVKPLIARRDFNISWKPALKSLAPDVYKSKSYIDCYNLI